MDQQNPQVDSTKTDNVPVQPGSLKFAPVNPELGPIETLVPSIEIPNVETEKPQEKQQNSCVFCGIAAGEIKVKKLLVINLFSYYKYLFKI